ncbi:hypothetical protein [Acidianus brierleyi]|uniref:hypothetical protein n=1 Tax=Acidianus brierleyi TaxID=41673 RepID=UPI001FE5DAA1|nr:hypothetical protein [Acidianus brierleyi]
MSINCRSDSCKKVFKYLSRKEGTLEIIDQAPKAYPGFKSYIRKIIKKEELLFKDIVLGEDIVSAMESGYKNALMGFLRSAEESNRFIIERACLTVFVSATTPKYIDLLRKKKWHTLVDLGYIIRAESEGTGRMKKFANRKVKLDQWSVYLMGKPFCKKHVKILEYSIPVEDLEEKLKMRIDARCSLCHKPADYFTLAMPKASALIGLAGYIKGKDVTTLMKTYANISRILHPYGFNDINKDKVFTIWARDFLTVITEINDLLNLVDGSRSSSDDGNPTIKSIKNRKGR